MLLEALLFCFRFMPLKKCRLLLHYVKEDPVFCDFGIIINFNKILVVKLINNYSVTGKVIIVAGICAILYWGILCVFMRGY